jgi:hypothetical protein
MSWTDEGCWGLGDFSGLGEAGLSDCDVMVVWVVSLHHSTSLVWGGPAPFL